MSDNSSTYRRALAIWGNAAQWQMLQEECGELVAAVSKFHRGRINIVDLAGEIADVQIMCEQATEMVGAEVVAEARVEKLYRLEDRIADAERRIRNR